MSEEQKPTEDKKPEPAPKLNLTKEILVKQHEEAVRQLNKKLDEVEQMKGIVNYTAGLLNTYELPSAEEKPGEKK